MSLTCIHLSSSAPAEVGDDGLIWKETLRTGVIATRPGGGARPLVIKLRAEAPGELGLQDIYDGFYDGAVEHVTIPKSHNDKVDENTGFVRALKIVPAEDAPGAYKLLAGCEFTEPDIKGQVERGTIANTSVGVFFNHVRKRDGKTYKQALGHMALTNRPWVSGMKPFGLSDDDEFYDFVVEPERVELSEAQARRDAVLLGDKRPLPGGTPEKDNWVDHQGGLPTYVREVANALIRDGRPKREAIQIAIGKIKKWATTSKDAAVRAKAAKAVAKWESMKAKSKAQTAAKKVTASWEDDVDFVEALQLSEDGLELSGGSMAVNVGGYMRGGRQVRGYTRKGGPKEAAALVDKAVHQTKAFMYSMGAKKDVWAHDERLRVKLAEHAADEPVHTEHHIMHMVHGMDMVLSFLAAKGIQLSDEEDDELLALFMELEDDEEPEEDDLGLSEAPEPQSLLSDLRAAQAAREGALLALSQGELPTDALMLGMGGTVMRKARGPWREELYKRGRGGKFADKPDAGRQGSTTAASPSGALQWQSPSGTGRGAPIAGGPTGAARGGGRGAQQPMTPEERKATYDKRVGSLTSRMGTAIQRGIQRNQGQRPSEALGGYLAEDEGGITAAGKINQKRLLQYAREAVPDVHPPGADGEGIVLDAPTTAAKYAEVGPDGNYRWDPERKPIHDAIIDAMLRDPKTGDYYPSQEKPSVFFTGGGYAAGKGGVLRLEQFGSAVPQEALTLDPDIIKGMIPEFDALLEIDPSANLAVYEEAWEIAKAVQGEAIKRRMSVVVDGISNTSPEEFFRRVESFTSKGYQYHGDAEIGERADGQPWKARVTYVNISTDEAVKRSVKRAETSMERKDRRHIPEVIQRSVHRDVAATIPGVLKEAYARGVYAEVWDNERDVDPESGFAKPARIAHVGPDGGLVVDDQELWNALLKKGGEKIEAVDEALPTDEPKPKKAKDKVMAADPSMDPAQQEFRPVKPDPDEGMEPEGEEEPEDEGNPWMTGEEIYETGWAIDLPFESGDAEPGPIRYLEESREQAQGRQNQAKQQPKGQPKRSQ